MTTANQVLRDRLEDAEQIIQRMMKKKPSDTVIETISGLLADAMDVSVKNGANSVSMPDEYVEVAVWLMSLKGK